jgi:hypothetical protein
MTIPRALHGHRDLLRLKSAALDFGRLLEVVSDFFVTFISRGDLLMGIPSWSMVKTTIFLASCCKFVSDCVANTWTDDEPTVMSVLYDAKRG